MSPEPALVRTAGDHPGGSVIIDAHYLVPGDRIVPALYYMRRVAVSQEEYAALVAGVPVTVKSAQVVMAQTTGQFWLRQGDVVPLPDNPPRMARVIDLASRR